MKLSRAMACMDCDEVYESEAGRRTCPGCASAAPPLMLARVLAPRPLAETLPATLREHPFEFPKREESR